MNRTRPKQIVIRVSEEELAQIKKKGGAIWEEPATVHH
mgnify:CR=1 FL=1|jgi:predicted DNA binding CopG/RHH family protein